MFTDINVLVGLLIVFNENALRCRVSTNTQYSFPLFFEQVCACVQRLTAVLVVRMLIVYRFTNQFIFTFLKMTLRRILCSKCAKLYIGETGQRLSNRFAKHLCSVRNNDVDKPLAWHFNTANHSISDMKICAISPISGGNDRKSVSFSKLEQFIPKGSIKKRFSFMWSFIVSVFI